MVSFRTLGHTGPCGTFERIGQAMRHLDPPYYIIASTLQRYDCTAHHPPTSTVTVAAPLAIILLLLMAVTA